MKTFRAKRPLAALASVAVGTALAVSLAGPALAAAPGVASADPTQAPALEAWIDADSVSVASASPAATVQGSTTQSASSQGASTESASSEPTAGKILTHKHGGPLLWTENVLEWYWNSSKITSSDGSQEYGYLFPNTASDGGIVRTLKTNSQHDWRGTMIVGVGVVTPWGNVDISRSTKTDYYELVRGGSYYINP